MQSDGPPCQICPLREACHSSLKPMRKTHLIGDIYTAKPHRIENKWLSCVHFTCPVGIEAAKNALRQINNPEYQLFVPVQYTRGGGSKPQKVITFESPDKPTLYAYNTIGCALYAICSRVVNGRGTIFSLNESGIYSQTGQNIFSINSYYIT